MDAATLTDLVARSYQTAGAPARVLLALSGGADSVCLLYTLHALRERYGFLLFAAHVHHGLRGEADEDAQFVRALCGRLGVEVSIHPVVVAPGNMEASARDARYAALRAQAKVIGAPVIALAHQADDQAETILMHWMRGAGTAGLAGMREYSNGLWRPLLSVTRSEILGVLAQYQASWREDPTNCDASLLRNALRLDVLPRLRMLAPAFDRSVGRAARILALEEDFAQGQAEQWLLHHGSVHPSSLFVMADDCLTLHPALQRRVIRGLSALAGHAPDMDLTDRLLALLPKTCGSVNLPGGGQALRTKRRLHFLPLGRTAMPLGTLIADVPDDAPASARGTWQVFDVANMHGAILRYGQAGDRINPLGMQETIALGRYLANQQVDLPFRMGVPVLARGPDVLWAIGVGISGLAAVGSGTRRRIKVRYVGRLPWAMECDQQEGHEDV